MEPSAGSQPAQHQVVPILFNHSGSIQAKPGPLAIIDYFMGKRIRRELSFYNEVADVKELSDQFQPLSHSWIGGAAYVSLCVSNAFGIASRQSR